MHLFKDKSRKACWSINLFYARKCFCLYIYVCTTCVQRTESQKRTSYPWNWSFRYLWVSLEVLKTESRSLAKTTRALKHRSISQALGSGLLRVNPKSMEVWIPYLYSYYSWVKKSGVSLLYACRVCVNSRREGAWAVPEAKQRKCNQKNISQ